MRSGIRSPTATEGGEDESDPDSAAGSNRQWVLPPDMTVAKMPREMIKDIVMSCHRWGRC